MAPADTERVFAELTVALDLEIPPEWTHAQRRAVFSVRA